MKKVGFFTSTEWVQWGTIFMAYGYLYICNELIIYSQVTITDVGTYKTVSLPMMVFVVITIGKIRIRIGFNWGNPDLLRLNSN